jgi:anaerobic selenocysteine-containing dehydrogenase
VADEYSPPLQVVGFVATRRGDPERGPEVRMRADEAALRLLQDGELVRIVGPRRQEVATLRVDDALPRGAVMIRDVAGVAPSEVVRVRKVETDLPRRVLG